MAAESVGLAGSVVGLVSFGLQVTGGIFKYVDAFENRQDDLAFVRQQNETLRSTLQLIEEYVVAQGQPPEVATTVSGSMQSFEKALYRIEKLYPELVDSGGKSWTSRLDNRKKRFTYPFKRSKIQELGRQLETARGTLQFTLDALNMRVSRQQQSDMQAVVEVSFRGLSSETQLIRSALAAVEAPVIDIRDQLSTTREDIKTSTQLLVAQYGAMSYQAQESHRASLRHFQETANLVQHVAEMFSKQHQETMKKLERLAGKTEHIYGRRRAPLALARTLADKPALLNEVSNALQPFEQAQNQLVALDPPKKTTGNTNRILAPVKTPQLQSILGRMCICRRQRSVRDQKRIQLGDSSFFGGWETQSHWDACPLSKVGGKKRRVAMGFNYTGLAHVLKTAINMSFALTYGAGGFSISPSFACIPTVDDTLDPAFRILSLIAEGFRHFRNGLEHLMLACMKRLIRLFDDGKVCPTAINGNNESLMHRAMNAIFEAQVYSYGGGFGGMELFFVELVQTLLSYGVAPFTYDKWGLSPLLQIDPCMFGKDIVQPVLNVLFQADLESQPLALNISSMDRDIWVPVPTSDVKLKCASSSRFAEACECGPLSMAVIQDDPVAASQVLNRNPRAINEVNIFGQSPLHLAATNPWILEMLLTAGDRDPSLLDHCDVFGFTALEVAMMNSSDFCINFLSIERCYDHECDCCRCIDLFLAAGCSVRMHQLDESHRTNAPELYVFLANASELARRKYVFHMKICRTVIQSPHPRDVSPVTNFAAADDLSWIFNEIADPHLGALFYRHGFEPHSSCLTNLTYNNRIGQDTMNFAYLHWLTSHGVDMSIRSSKGPARPENSPNCGVFGAHHAFAFIKLDFSSETGRNLLRDQSDDAWDTYMELTAATFRQDLTDGCQCYCTVNGCTPFTWMMKGNSLFGGSPIGSPEPPSRNARDLQSHYRQCGPELTILTYKAAIRYATFSALDLCHTCCLERELAQDWREQARRHVDDIKTINEKQASVLETLEDLVLQFEEKAADYLATDSTGNQGSFHEFWSEYWEVRMGQELVKLHEKKLKEGEEKGPQESETRSWGPQREVEEENPYDKKTDVKYWLYELDKICPEYSEPWPEDSCRFSEVL